MKKIILILILVLGLVSCGKENVKVSEKGSADSTWSIENTNQSAKVENSWNNKVVNESDNKNIDVSEKENNVDYLKFCEQIQKDNFKCILKSDDDKAYPPFKFYINKVWKWPKIKLWDFVKVSVPKWDFIFFIWKNWDWLETNMKALVWIPIWSEIVVERTNIQLKSKVTKKEFIDFITKLYWEQNVKKIKKEIEKKQIKSKIIISIRLNWQQTGLVFEKIKLWGKFKYWDEVCFNKENKIECIKLKKSWYISKFINDYWLGIGTKFRLYYNWGNGGVLTEIVDK